MDVLTAYQEKLGLGTYGMYQATDQLYNNVIWTP